MKKTYHLSGPEAIAADFEAVYSPISKRYPVFRYADGAAVNAYDAEAGDFDYISYLSKARYGVGTTARAACSFDHFGAPLIVITDDIRVGDDGRPRYGLHFEAVAFAEGINVWHIQPWPERTERPIRPTLIASARFPIAAESRVDISVTVGEKTLSVCVNGVPLTVGHPDIPAQFCVGFTACENINRFYTFTVEN